MYFFSKFRVKMVSKGAPSKKFLPYLKKETEEKIKGIPKMRNSAAESGTFRCGFFFFKNIPQRNTKMRNVGKMTLKCGFFFFCRFIFLFFGIWFFFFLHLKFFFVDNYFANFYRIIQDKCTKNNKVNKKKFVC